MSVAAVSPQEVAERCKTGQVDLLDVRTPAEFQEIHASIARNVPLDRLDPAALAKERDPKQGPLYVVCRSGSRGRQACEKLLAAGFDVRNIEGGMQAWEQAGLPVVRGRKTMSLERQVRIAAGTLVLIGTALGFFVHPAFLGLSAFVGAGLVFAGVTDTCGMGMLLARMPWNQVKPTASASACSV